MAKRQKNKGIYRFSSNVIVACKILEVITISKIEKLKRKTEHLRYGSVWSVFKKELLMNPYVSISVAISLLLIGGYIAAIINYISIAEGSLLRFILSSSFSFIILMVGFIFFLPFWKFRRKYYFLENQNDEIAQRLVNIYNKSQQALTSFHHVNAVQLFEIEMHTDDKHVQYRFDKIFSIKSRYFNLSRLKNKEFEVPTALFEWLNNPKGFRSAPDYGETINGLIYEWLERRSKDDKKYEEIIDNWDITFNEKPNIKSIHYHVLFEPKESINADNYQDALDGIVDPVFSMEYNGDKEEHRNRRYFSVRVQLNDQKSGILECLLLIIGNKYHMDTSKINQIVSGILNNEGDKHASCKKEKEINTS